MPSTLVHSLLTGTQASGNVEAGGYAGVWQAPRFISLTLPCPDNRRGMVAKFFANAKNNGDRYGSASPKNRRNKISYSKFP